MNEVLVTPEEQARLDALPYRLPSKLRDLLDIFKWACRKKNTSGVFIFDGRSGMGKTTLSFQTGLYCDPNFSLANVYFTPEAFLEGLRNAQPGTIHVFDEALLISSRSAMSQINKMTIQAMSMIRSKKIIVIFNVNSIFDLDRNLALSRADLLLHVYGESLTDRGKFMAFFTGMDGWDRIKHLYLHGKKYYDYSKPKSNFNTTFSSYFVLDEEIYEKKKQEGINKFLSGDTKIGRADYKARKSRDNLVIWIRNNTKLNIKEMSEIAEVTTATIDKIISDWKYRQEDSG